MAERSYDRVVVKDQDGNPTVEWDRPVFGDLVVKTEGGRTIIERTGWFGGTTTYVPSEGESVKAEGG
jgi:hypothetical protein